MKRSNPFPVIAVTAFAMKGDEEKIRAGGCEDYISKPISVMRFLEVIQTYLNKIPEKIIEESVSMVADETIPSFEIRDESAGDDAAGFDMDELAMVDDMDHGQHDPVDQATGEKPLPQKDVH